MAALVCAVSQAQQKAAPAQKTFATPQEAVETLIQAAGNYDLPALLEIFGLSAPLGRLNYVIQGTMIGGFALLATPAQYRVTGVKTFMVSNDGIVYEKDLGIDTLKIAKEMELYNPDKTWHHTTDGWPADASPSTTAAKEEP